MNEKIKVIFDRFFHLNFIHHVLICKSHEHALMSKKVVILDYVHQYHTYKKKIIKNISIYLESIELLLGSDDISLPAFDEPRISFLKPIPECTNATSVRKFLIVSTT